jgi:putative glutamine transport system ATP-binding protein
METNVKPMIELKSLNLHFGALHVLKGISLQIPDASKTVIIGPSGSGKSTLLRTVNCFERPQKGEVWVDGQCMTRLRSGALHKARENIGMVFQSFNLYPHKTVLENLTMAPMILKKEKKESATERARMHLKNVGLLEKADAYPAMLSGGQQQRVAIARALTMQPKIMLFDEPTSALDPEMIKEVIDIMLEVAREKITMLFVTHEMSFASKIADRILFLDGGTIIEDGPPDQVFNHPRSDRTRLFLSKIA